MSSPGFGNLAPTLDLARAARETWDVVIVGAGPAGALSACLLARRGYRVVLIDHAQFPRDKVCGCCLNGAAVGVLAAAGLGDLLPTLGAVVLRSQRLAGGGAQAQLPLRANWILSRRALDAGLVAAAVEHGAAFLPGTSARLREGVDAGQATRTLLLQQPGRTVELTSRLVLACDGLGGHLLDAEPGARWRIGRSSRLGAGAILAAAPAEYAAGVVHMAVGRQGYVGLVRLEDQRLNIAAALDPAACRVCGGPGPLAQRILMEAGLPALPALAGAAWSGTALLTRRRGRLGGHRVLALGDACGYVEPFTGEGMAWALGAASLAQDLVAAALTRWEPQLIEQWNRRYERAFFWRRSSCVALARLLRYPPATTALCRLLHCFPRVSVPILGMLNRPLRGGARSVMPMDCTT